MKKVKKLQALALIAGLTAATAGFALWNAPTQVSAEEATFAMRNAASVRAVENEVGIRWETSVTKAWYDANIPSGATEVTFGTLVTAASNATLSELDENSAEVKELVPTQQADFSASDTYTYQGSIVYTDVNEWTETEKKAAYGTELVAKGFVKYKAEGATEFTYKFAEASDTARCMRAVALDEYDTTDVNDDLMKKYLGNEQTDVDFAGYYETANPEAVVDYKVAYVGAKKVGEVNEGKLTLNGLTLGENYTLNLFDADGNYAKTTEFQYVTKTISDKDEFTQYLNVPEGETRTGYYAITTNITIGSWTPEQGTFNGTLDGNGHRLNAVSVGTTSGLFYQVKDATIKNVALCGSVLGANNAGGNAGAIAYETLGTTTVENVYVDLAAQPFSEAVVENATHESTANAYKGGLFCNANNSDEIIVKDSVVYIPEHMTSASGFVAVFANNENGKITLTDSTFIGGNGKLVSQKHENTTVSQTNVNVCDAVAAHKTYKASWTSMCAAAYNADHAFVELTAENFASTLPTLTKQIVVLTGNVDLGNTNLGVENTSFSGVFDGQGNTISGVQPQNSLGGLFYTLAGSVKNVAVIGSLLNAGGKQSALIAENSANSAYLENVYVELTSYRQTQSAPLIRSIPLHAHLSMKDIVVNYTKETNFTKNGVATLIHHTAKTISISTENCYWLSIKETAKSMVGTSSVFAGDLAETLIFTEERGVKGFKASTTLGTDSGATNCEEVRAAFDAAVEAGTVKLTDFIKGVMYPTTTA